MTILYKLLEGGGKKEVVLMEMYDGWTEIYLFDQGQRDSGLYPRLVTLSPPSSIHRGKGKRAKPGRLKKCHRFEDQAVQDTWSVSKKWEGLFQSPRINEKLSGLFVGRIEQHKYPSWWQSLSGNLPVGDWDQRKAL